MADADMSLAQPPIDKTAFKAQQLWLLDAEKDESSDEEEAVVDDTPPARARSSTSRYESAIKVMKTPDRRRVHDLQKQLQVRYALRSTTPPALTLWMGMRRRACSATGCQSTRARSALRPAFPFGARACSGCRRRSTRSACVGRCARRRPCASAPSRSVARTRRSGWAR